MLTLTNYGLLHGYPEAVVAPSKVPSSSALSSKSHRAVRAQRRLFYSSTSSVWESREPRIDSSPRYPPSPARGLRRRMVLAGMAGTRVGGMAGARVLPSAGRPPGMGWRDEMGFYWAVFKVIRFPVAFEPRLWTRARGHIRPWRIWTSSLMGAREGPSRDVGCASNSADENTTSSEPRS